MTLWCLRTASRNFNYGRPSLSLAGWKIKTCIMLVLAGLEDTCMQRRIFTLQIKNNQSFRYTDRIAYPSFSMSLSCNWEITNSQAPFPWINSQHKIFCTKASLISRNLANGRSSPATCYFNRNRSTEGKPGRGIEILSQLYVHALFDITRNSNSVSIIGDSWTNYFSRVDGALLYARALPPKAFFVRENLLLKPKSQFKPFPALSSNESQLNVYLHYARDESRWPDCPVWKKLYIKLKRLKTDFNTIFWIERVLDTVVK